jgi:type IV secretion system protein VirB2
VSAVNWLQGTLLGTVATVVAVIAVASVGFMMLTGRMNWRHGAVVIIGCFILFGAASIVAGIRQAAGAG